MFKAFAQWLRGTTLNAPVETRPSLRERYQNRRRYQRIGADQTVGYDKAADLLSRAARLVPIRTQVRAADGSLVAYDSGDAELLGVKSAYQMTAGATEIPNELLSWFAAQTYIGVQLAAIFSQHWLIDKACTMPARDALRHGYEVTFAGVTEKEQQRELADYLAKANKRFKVNKNLEEYIRMGRIMGQRIALFKVTPPPGITEDEFYYHPFNIDAVTPGSYKGISQIDQTWCFPVLDSEVMTDPTDEGFYEPTWWRIGPRLYHKSHLAIFRNAEVPDILKPLYNYGGVSIPQRMYERIYASERTANEAPLLAMTKRSTVWKTDLAEMVADQEATGEMLGYWERYRDNYGIKLAEKDDDVLQLDTSLADLDAVIMTQFQLVAAIAGVPATKLLGTSPKGFNATGDNETDSYHEELESLQANDLEPMLERHLMLLAKSELEPEFGMEWDDMDATVKWNPVDSPSAKERAEINSLNADTAIKLASVGAIDGMDERNRISQDTHSGYTDLAVVEDDDLFDDDTLNAEENSNEREEQEEDEGGA